MIVDEKVEKYYEENYQNEKMAAGYNINKQLKIDLQICCAELTRKSKKAITPSSTIRLLVVQFLLENKKKD